MPKKQAASQGYDADTELEVFQEVLRGRIESFVGKRISRRVSLINRRLDALARLLERGSICVAVRYDASSKKLIISSNKVHQCSHNTNQVIKGIQRLMELLAKHDASKSEVIEELSSIIAENLRQEFRHLLCNERPSS